MTTRRLEPIHPGEILEEEFMRPQGLSANALARRIDVPVTRISEIVRGNRGITADTALRLARLFGTSSELWLGLQAEYDLRVARRDLADVIQDRIVPLKKQASRYGERPSSPRSSVGEQADRCGTASTHRRDRDRRRIRRPSPSQGKQARVKEAFFAIADRLVQASDGAERESLKEELARLTFGDSSGHRGKTRENRPTRNALEPKRSSRVRTGVPLLSRRPKGSRRPTIALVNKLRDEE